MKKLIKKCIAISLVLITVVVTALIVASATISVYNGYSYTDMDNGYISICGWDNRSESFVVPAQLDDRYVKEIADFGMKDNAFITSVNFVPATYMMRIGMMAFKGCTSLDGTLSLPARLIDIGTAAFQDCNSIDEVNYYSASYSVPNQCFFQCSDLKKVLIGNSVRAIGDYAFAECGQLEKITIPKNVIDISPAAFSGCPNAVIYCYTDSYAHQYAVDNGIDFVLIDAPDPTIPPTEPDTQEPTHQTVDVTFILGDADGDGFITIIDATKVQRVLADLDKDTDGMITLRAAVDGDVLNIMHATKIQRYLAEFDVTEPIGEEVTRQIEI